ncbi:MAG: GNAT family N-acetyltransferase [Hydrogenophaga sp.]|uniref:GNAT family N-acetyltransferase n=1 Tax=Hydrogenophaga sp. TaxID=1904254 RepID=UPI00275979AA|nr:GNAT family N-acetyltransferase [Hydrogenophaga sp.]MDP2417255.1 GNAT family N-acetyltransferase [Hydrogenophaga sp.]MDZ4187481.1 GNAT family N-acetyltransferase [Hydrogenophaga sp.]
MFNSTSWPKPVPDAQVLAATPVDARHHKTPKPIAQQTEAAGVPIRSIGVSHRERIAAHLLALEPQDRYLRFGYVASDEQIHRYVDQLDFDRDELFGIFNRKLELIAMAHLAFSGDPNCINCAEFGVSVSKSARGRGYGRCLFERAVMHARNEGVNLLFIHALSENNAMLKIARQAGAVVKRDGSESEAHVHLPPADFDSRMTELFQEHVALTDYHLKAQVKQFWAVLAPLQELRQGVRSAHSRFRN